MTALLAEADAKNVSLKSPVHTIDKWNRALYLKLRPARDRVVFLVCDEGMVRPTMRHGRHKLQMSIDRTGRPRWQQVEF